MNAEDLYAGREDLMSAEEREEWNHDPQDDDVPTYSTILRSWLLGDNFQGLSPPDAEGREEFLARKPALGATPALLQELEEHYQRITPVQQRMLLGSIRHKMLRQLIPCCGAKTLDDHIHILREEMESGTPSPVPGWYDFSTVRYGPRRIGYYECENRGCSQTETVDKAFSRCVKCKLAY